MQLQKSSVTAEILPIWVTNKNEVDVFKSKSGLPLCQLDRNGEDMLTAFIGQWSVDLGIVIGLDAFELTYIENWIKENYPSMTISQLNLAKKLALTRQLDCNPVPYGKLSPLYIGGIINAYTEYEERVDSRIRDNKKKFDLQQIELSKIKSVEENEMLNRKARQDNYILIKNSSTLVNVIPGVWNIAVAKQWVDVALLEDTFLRSAIETQIGKIKGSPEDNPAFRVVNDDEVTRYIKYKILKDYFTTNEINFLTIE